MLSSCSRRKREPLKVAITTESVGNVLVPRHRNLPGPGTDRQEDVRTRTEPGALRRCSGSCTAGWTAAGRVLRGHRLRPAAERSSPRPSLLPLTFVVTSLRTATESCGAISRLASRRATLLRSRFAGRNASPSSLRSCPAIESHLPAPGRAVPPWDSWYSS